MYACLNKKYSVATILILMFTALSGCQTTDGDQSANKQLATQLEQIGVSSREDERGLIISLPVIFFDFDSSNLKASARLKIGEVADILNQDIVQVRQILIEGHSDDIGDPDYNLNLSAKRAEVVLKELVFSNILGERLASAGKGETSPVSDNSSSEGRQKNRRVEIIILNSG